MPKLFVALLRLSALGLVAVLVGCADLAAALPPRPTPFPTLARLPSVTPVTPSPIPTVTPVVPTVAIAPTPTIIAVQAIVTITANVRSGPATTFDILTTVEAGAPVAVTGRAGDWYLVNTADGSAGWLFGQLIDVPPELAETVPTVEP